MNRIRIKKALTDQHKAYRSHIEHFWQNAKFIADPPSIQSFVKVGNEDVEVVITEDLIRRVLDLGDRPEDPTGYPARMVKGCFYRMGYTGHVNETNFSKAEARARKAVAGTEAANANKGKEKVDAVREIRPEPEAEPESEPVDITQFVLIGEAYDVSYET
ncbi:hypothetical protein HanHA300_Chr11g0389381 [Helianthus annuus]|nr:hypothetical protein HanHA300_Chr11g0389381 [Helianthus annuus]KAJ0807374.1 hypothetical protein HanOQP8_Chr00c048g0733411 [Helianthus annuus]